MNEFHENALWCRSLSATFTTLIPKKKGAMEIEDFRPISLVGSMHKLLAKVLALRLETVLREVILEYQCAFIKGRHIVDCSFIANELVDEMIKRNEAGVICQLDMETAYDHLNWDFLDIVLRRVGFGRKWRNWMKVYVSLALFSIFC